jgi:hypothetical protein
MIAGYRRSIRKNRCINLKTLLQLPPFVPLLCIEFEEEILQADLQRGGTLQRKPGLLNRLFYKLKGLFLNYI